MYDQRPRPQVPNDQLKIAHEMVQSYCFDKPTGTSTYNAPAGVTDVEVMKALILYCKRQFENFGRDIIFGQHLAYFERIFPEEFPDVFKERDYSNRRQITIIGVVEGTAGKDLETMQEVLNQKSLVFSDPRDQVIAAALHALQYNGADLFQGFWVRGSVPVYVLNSLPNFGVNLNTQSSSRGFDHVAASGTPIEI